MQLHDFATQAPGLIASLSLDDISHGLLVYAMISFGLALGWIALVELGSHFRQALDNQNLNEADITNPDFPSPGQPS